MANIGIVVLLTGSAILVDATGAQRPLKLGDSLQAGDTVICPKGATVELQLANGNTIQIAAQQTVTFTQELADAIEYNLAEPTDNAVSQATIQSLIQAIGSGDNIDDIKLGRLLADLARSAGAGIGQPLRRRGEEAGDAEQGAVVGRAGRDHPDGRIVGQLEHRAGPAALRPGFEQQGPALDIVEDRGH